MKIIFFFWSLYVLKFFQILSFNVCVIDIFFIFRWFSLRKGHLCCECLLIGQINRKQQAGVCNQLPKTELTFRTRIRHFIPMHLLKSATSYQCMVRKTKPCTSHIFHSMVHIFSYLDILLKMSHYFGVE